MKDIIIKQDEPLSKHSTFGIGGNANLFFEIRTEKSLIKTIFTLKKMMIKYKIIGNASNILFDSKGYGGAIIKFNNNKIIRKGNNLIVGSGVNISKINSFCIQNNLGGLEFCCGIPATIGGAVVNNLGAFGLEIKDFVKSVTVLDGNKIKKYLNKDCNFLYRDSVFKLNKNLIILSVELNLIQQSFEETTKKCKEYLSKKATTQPLNLPSVGSIFKRGENYIPAKLIEDLNLKGKTIGGAMISTKHSGFIVNYKNATSEDVLALVNAIKEEIFTKFEIKLQEEFEYISY